MRWWIGAVDGRRSGPAVDRFGNLERRMDPELASTSVADVMREVMPCSGPGVFSAKRGGVQQRLW